MNDRRAINSPKNISGGALTVYCMRKFKYKLCCFPAIPMEHVVLYVVSADKGVCCLYQVVRDSQYL